MTATKAPGFRAFALIKRKPGSTREELIQHYENIHAPLAIETIPNLRKYVRHYIRDCDPFTADPVDLGVELPYDIITEMWFDNCQEFLKGMAFLKDAVKAQRIKEDEEKVFDRASIRFVTADDFESVPKA
jgi:hypothetical protein